MRALQGRPDWGGFLQADWGGGVLFDLGVHPLAVALLVARAAAGMQTGPRPVAGSCPCGPSSPGPTTSTWTSRPACGSPSPVGLVATVEASWASDQAVWDLQAASDTGVVRAELIPNLALERDGEPVPLPPLPAGADIPQVHQFGYVVQLEELLADFAAGREPLMGAEFGREVLELVCAAYASAGRGGEPVSLPFDGPRDRTPLQLWRDS